MSYNVKEAGGTLLGVVDAPEEIKADFPVAFDEGNLYYIEEAGPVYKRRANGSIDKMSFWFYFKGSTWYIRTIIENNKGAETREYNSVVKEVNSKVYFRVCLERLLAKRTKKLERDGWSLETTGEGPLKEPMLLHKWEDYKDTVVYPLILQPKLNGVRATWCPLQEELFSRKRTKLVLPHIQAELRGWRGVDAEIWNAEMSFEEISGAVRSADPTNPAKERLEVWVFDHFGDKPYCRRLEDLIRKENGSRIKVIPSIIVHNEEEVNTWFERIMKERGVDGVVLRDPDAPYRFDHRSSKVLKKKALLSAEYPIIGAGSVADSEYALGLITFIVLVGEEQLEVIPNWTKGRRAGAMAMSTYYIGKPLTLEFREYTNSGLPKHIVSVEVRDYEG
jgi:DNA ligase-1